MASVWGRARGRHGSGKYEAEPGAGAVSGLSAPAGKHAGWAAAARQGRSFRPGAAGAAQGAPGAWSVSWPEFRRDGGLAAADPGAHAGRPRPRLWPRTPGPGPRTLPTGA